jgi:isocitrate/isopropylmalate dehydrogenase
MPTHNLLLLAGDGIGPEVMAEVKRLIAWMNAHGMGTFESEEGLVGGCAYDAHGVAVTDDLIDLFDVVFLKHADGSDACCSGIEAGSGAVQSNAA